MKSIYHYLLVPVISIILILAFTVAAFSLYGLHSRIAPELEALSTDALQARADQVSLWLDSKITEIEYLSYTFSDYSFQEEDHAVLLKGLNNFLDKNNHSFESLGIITMDGTKHVTDGSSFNVTERAYFQDVKQIDVRTAISSTIYSKANSERIILIITEVRGTDGVVKGYLSGAITIDYLEDIVSEAGLNGYPMYIVNGADYSLVAGAYNENQILHNDRILHSRIPSSPDWYISVRIPARFLQDTMKEYMTAIILFVIPVFLAAILLITRFTGHVIRPLKHMEQYMLKSQSGTLEQMPCNTKISEIRSLTDSYNSMITNIGQLIQRLKQEERLKIEAENKALYSQIKPHFLYNTLETIQAIAYDNEDEQVELAIGNLATLFRIGLSSGRQMIPLQDELSHVKSYLDIQLLRYGSLFTYEVDTDSTNLSLLFLKFTLQPLVENAIYHGIKNGEKKGFLLIRIRETQKGLFVEVKNTYHTLDPQRLQEVNDRMKRHISPTDSYGLYNVNQRLQVNFAEENGVILSFDSQYVTCSFSHPLCHKVINPERTDSYDTDPGGR